MRDLTSMQLSALMKAGVNIGNTFEAVIVGEDGSLSGDETCWGNPTPNKALFEGIKAAGFDVVRMPVAYSHQFEDASTYKIKSAWMDKVETAVKAALDAGLYVIINIHWEGGWLNHPVDANKEALDERLEAMWKQIALKFRDYDDRLLFAGTNEVNNDDADGAQPTEENYRVQNGFNQVFVNTVRATGGRNHYRHLIVQAYNTDVAKAVAHFTMPLDIVQNRIFLECHYYDPYDFTIMPNEEDFKSQWGAAFAGGDVSSTGQEADIEATLGSLNVFINDNVPVIIGEYGPTLRDQLTGEALENHLKSRNDYIEYVVKTCVKNKLVPLYWDAGYTEKLFDRTTGQPHNAASIAAIMEGLN